MPKRKSAESDESKLPTSKKEKLPENNNNQSNEAPSTSKGTSSGKKGKSAENKKDTKGKSTESKKDTKGKSPASKKDTKGKSPAKGAKKPPPNNDELIDALKSNNYNLVESLLEQEGMEVKVNLLSQEKRAPLFYAVKNSNVRLIKLLLANGANFKKDSESLSLAVAEKSVDIIKILLQNGADPNVKSKGSSSGKPRKKSSNKQKSKSYAYAFSGYGNRPNYGYGFGFDFDEDEDEDDADGDGDGDVDDGGFIGRDCSFDPYDKPEPAKGYDRQTRGRTPLHLAADIGRTDAVNVLIEYGADVNCTTHLKLTPLIVAAYKHNLEIIRILLESNAKPDLVDKFKFTAFHVAVKNRRFNVLETLVNFCFTDIQLLLNTKIQEYPVPYFFISEKWGNGAVAIGHWIKMLAAGLITPEEQKKLIELAGMDPLSRKNYQDFKNACLLEVSKLKNEKMGASGIPYFEILTDDEDQLLYFAKSDGEIAKVFQSVNLEAKFKIYGSVLKSQFQKGATRRKLLEKGAEVSQLLMNITLPDLVMEKILKYLDNREIKVFITACNSCSDNQ